MVDNAKFCGTGAMSMVENFDILIIEEINFSHLDISDIYRSSNKTHDMIFFVHLKFEPYCDIKWFCF